MNSVKKLNKWLIPFLEINVCWFSNIVGELLDCCSEWNKHSCWRHKAFDQQNWNELKIVLGINGSAIFYEGEFTALTPSTGMTELKKYRRPGRLCDPFSGHWNVMLYKWMSPAGVPSIKSGLYHSAGAMFGFFDFPNVRWKIQIVLHWCMWRNSPLQLSSLALKICQNFFPLFENENFEPRFGFSS